MLVTHRFELNTLIAINRYVIEFLSEPSDRCQFRFGPFDQVIYRFSGNRHHQLKIFSISQRVVQGTRTGGLSQFFGVWRYRDLLQIYFEPDSAGVRQILQINSQRIAGIRAGVNLMLFVSPSLGKIKRRFEGPMFFQNTTTERSSNHHMITEQGSVHHPRARFWCHANRGN